MDHQPTGHVARSARAGPRAAACPDRLAHCVNDAVRDVRFRGKQRYEAVAGRVHLVGCGRADHAGLGDADVLRAVIAEKVLPHDNGAGADGNRHFYGFECENLGNGKDPWPEVRLEATERAAAAVCRHHGRTERSVVGHLEWQPGKADPRGFTTARLREWIKERLKQ
ncbi:hypothetical protein GCM10010121_021750 [Streptomyces brasiliensis]|uniref:N-acetylmuramoyl-L-alanine amidase domain-containing protein n=1 Tax=Streptomyces brasiliensis TaxID=1954 RepID=A0A917KED1_9ACTN|nr:hypothetical protein GCM10010121_021750 [Streptomyces brasiliensis]